MQLHAAVCSETVPLDLFDSLPPADDAAERRAPLQQWQKVYNAGTLPRVCSLGDAPILLSVALSVAFRGLFQRRAVGGGGGSFGGSKHAARVGGGRSLPVEDEVSTLACDFEEIQLDDRGNKKPRAPYYAHTRAESDGADGRGSGADRVHAHSTDTAFDVHSAGQGVVDDPWVGVGTEIETPLPDWGGGVADSEFVGYVNAASGCLEVSSVLLVAHDLRCALAAPLLFDDAAFEPAAAAATAIDMCGLVARDAATVKAVAAACSIRLDDALSFWAPTTAAVVLSETDRARLAVDTARQSCPA